MVRMPILVTLNSKFKEPDSVLDKQIGLRKLINSYLRIFVFCLLLFATNISCAIQPSQGKGTTTYSQPIQSQGVESKLSQKDFKEKVALFPFENFSDDKDALSQVMPVIKSQLEKRGLEVLDEDSLNKFLLKERIRSTGYISKDIALKIKNELNVNAILLGSINSFFQGGDLRFGLTARLIDSSNSAILWADHFCATGEDFKTVFDLGIVKTMDGLIPKVVDKLFSSFRTTPPYKEIESTYKIAIMPFQNKSKVNDAGMITTYMFLAELFKSQRFVPVEYGEVRSLIVELRVRDRGELNLKSMKAMSEILGFDRILVGTVEVYNEGEGNAPPKAAISARLIDVNKNRILWVESYELNGDDSIVILDWGKIRSAENVAYKVVSKLVKEMDKTKWL